MYKGGISGVAVEDVLSKVSRKVFGNFAVMVGVAARCTTDDWDMRLNSAKGRSVRRSS